MKRIIHISCLVILFLSFASLNTNAQDALNDYLVQAAENNPGLKARFNEYLAALEQVPQVGSLPDPQVAFGYSIQPVETRHGPMQFKISASQMFPWFGTLKARENTAVQQAKAKYEVFEESKSALFNEVRSTYYSLYFNEKALQIIQENLDILQRYQRMAAIKVEAGMVSAVDQYRLEMETGDLENQLALLKDQQVFLQVQFHELLNSQEQRPVSLPESLWETEVGLSKTAIRDSILQQNHQLLQLDLQQEALRFKQQVAEKSGKPSFNIGMDYTIIGKGENQMAGTDAFMFPMVGITIPLYRNKYKAMVQQVAYESTANSHQKQNTSNKLEILFEKAWKDYRDALRRKELYRSQVQLAENSLHVLETEYSSSSRNFEELLRMDRKLLNYALELEKAKADQQAAISVIHALMGN